MCLRSLTADIHVPTEIISKQTFLKLSKNNNNRLYASGVETEQEKLQPWSIYFARKLQTTESRSSVGGQLHPLLSWLAGAQQATRSPGTRCLQRCREGASVVGSTNILWMSRDQQQGELCRRACGLAGSTGTL